MEEIRPNTWDLRLQEIIDNHVVRLREDVHRLIEELPVPVLPLSDAPPESGPSAEAFIRLKESVQSIHSSTGQRDLARRLLDATTAQARRAGLFLARGETIRGFESRGFVTPGLDLSHFQASPQPGDPLAEALLRRESIHLRGCDLGDSALVDWLGGEEPTQVCLAPLVVGDRGVAVLYADSGPLAEGGWIHPEAVEILASVASLYLERLRLPSSGAASGTDPENATPIAPSLDSPAPPPRPNETVRMRLEKPSRSPAEETIRLRPAELFTPPPAPEPAVVSEPMTGAPVEEPHPSDEEAARFARLLVAEIVLYNDTQVKAGQKNADLSERLKEPITLSRQAFRDRFGAAPLERHFDAELIRTLALGNPALLGEKSRSR